MKNCLILIMIALLACNILHAQNRLVINQYIRTKVTDKTYTQKTGTTIPNDNLSITAANAKTWLVLEERFLPAQTGRMPWETEIVPLINNPVCHSQDTFRACNLPLAEYGACGTYVYDPGFSANLQTFTRHRIVPTGTFWNSGGSCGLSPGTSAFSALSAPADSTSMRLLAATVPGPLNRCGVWSCDVPKAGLTKWLYTKGKFYAPQTGTYFIGVAGDNFFRLQIDGADFVRNDLNPVTDESFKIWHIFPITLTAGNHELLISARNTGNEAIMGCEIYNTTETGLINATTTDALNIIFSTAPAMNKHLCAESPGSISVENYTTVSGTVGIDTRMKSLAAGVTTYHSRVTSDAAIVFNFTTPVPKLRLHIFTNEHLTENRLLNGETQASVTLPTLNIPSFRIEVHRAE